MEMNWLMIVASLSVILVIHLLLRRRKSSSLTLPPDPNFLPFTGTLQWLRQAGGNVNTSYLRSVHKRLGSIVTLRIHSFPEIFVADHTLAYEALVANSAVFADRPPPPPMIKVFSSDQHNITSASYGATWRLLRRNLMTEILNPARVKSYDQARRWVLDIILDRFRNNGSEKPIVVVDHLRYAMFALLVLMCFGDKLDEEQIKQVEFVQRQQLSSLARFKMLSLWPRLTKLIYPKTWVEFLKIRKEQEDVLNPLINARKKIVEERKQKKKSTEEDYIQAYVDTLFDLELTDENNRKLSETEIVSVASEFLNAGTDATATSLQWIMANLVKNQEIQEKLYQEVKNMTGEEDLQKMPYLKAVILEGLRRHPPGHFVLPHKVTEETVLGGYKVPKNGTVNFMVAELGRDPKVWEDPMVFKPERFIEEEVDITGSSGIKMMPFGAGRRMCPGNVLARLHLEYYVANMIKEFHWKEVEGDEVDLTESFEFTVVMKHSLKALAIPRNSS